MFHDNSSEDKANTNVIVPIIFLNKRKKYAYTYNVQTHWKLIFCHNLRNCDILQLFLQH